MGDDAIMVVEGDENDQRCVPFAVQRLMLADEQEHHLEFVLDEKDALKVDLGSNVLIRRVVT